MNKTKRWQWRFFIFYDDGELTYSLDDNPLTLPQGRINLRNCEEIIELINTNTNPTSNEINSSISYPNCLRLKFSNKDIYIAAGNYEEIIKWRDVLMFNCKQIILTEDKKTTNNLIKEFETLDDELDDDKANLNEQKEEDDEYQDTEFEDEYEKEFESIDSSSYNYKQTNLNRNRNDGLKLKMMCEIKNKKSKKSKKVDEEQQQNKDEEDAQHDPNSDSNNRRLSYKEDDLLRKQRLKENLNQLLIEYKHEEEAQLKKSSRFSMNNTQTIPAKTNNRISLDSCYPSSTNKLTHKTSAFSLVVPPQQKQQMPNFNSAFRPVNTTVSNKIIEQRAQNVDLVKKGCSSASSSEASSWSSSSSSSSSSNSPPKTRQSNLISISTEQNSNYKKPCLISPRKQLDSANKLDDSYASLLASNSALILASPTSLNKSLTIKVRNENETDKQLSPINKESQSQQNIEIIDLTNKTNRLIQHQRKSTLNSNASVNLSGYLWKTRDSYSTSNSFKSTNNPINDNQQFERFWFSLNTNLCCLIYWNDKHEQDLGKFPVGKYELAKCCQIFQQHQQSEFKLTFHQNTVSLNIRGNSIETTVNWYESIKHIIENLSSFCVKCKPKLVVNPMPLSVGITSNSSTSSQTASPQPVQQQPPPLPVSQPPQAVIEIKKVPDQFEFDTLKQKHDLLQKENSDLLSKFKLLEQIHLEAIAEYDNQQSQMFNQMDEMHSKLNKNESELDSLNKRLNSSKQQNETNLSQIKTLNDQLNKYKETIQLKDKEIESLSKEMLKSNDNSQEQDQVDASILTNDSYGSMARANWNKEVKNLDARITDVLGKLKERELSLNLTPISPSSNVIASSPNDDNYKIKFEKVQQQFQEAQIKIAQLNTQLKTTQSSTPTKTNASINLQDFSDDLAKVLMSKEEVITQLEKHLKDKEKQIQALTNQLNEELAQTARYQDALNLEQNRSNHLNNELNNLNSEQTAFTDEIDGIREQLNKTSSLVDSIQFKLDQTMAEKEQADTELKNLNEFTRNEIETLQEEIKTLEYKLVHSQRQAQEYQSILEDMDLSNTNTLNYLHKFDCGSFSVNNLNNESNSSIQNKLKKNQAQVSALMQQIIKQKSNDIEDLNERLTKMQNDLNELKEENVDLNDHIYSIDVFMREKDTQCDQFQKENQDLLQKLSELEQISNLEFDYTINENEEDNLNQTSVNYKIFCNKLKNLLQIKTTNLNDFIRLIINMCNQLITIFKLDSSSDLNLDENLIRTKISEQNVLDFLNDLFTDSANQSQSESTLNLINDLNEFNKTFKQSIGTENQTNFRNLKQSIVQLVKFINSQDLMQFNVQIVSYMAEQLVHKASINGNLKFACEFLKKKYNDTNSDNDNSLLIECSRLGPNKAITSPQSPINQQDNIGALESMNEQDEKIFKLASELLLSDENVLRKMSSQVLNEAQHLTQLNWVLNTLRKLRWKHLKLKSKDKLEQVLNNLKKIESTGSINYDSNVSETDSESESDSFNQRNKSTKANTSDLDGQLDVILEVIKEIFIQHKTQISEQLSEVQKLMSIAPDDDLLTHLQYI